MSERPQSKTTEVLKQSVRTIKSLRRQLDQATSASREPIAVVGLACRFPGGCDTPERFWSFLREGGIGLRDVPEDRWPIQDYYDPQPGKPGKMYVRQSNFMECDVTAFDARFFKISGVEANAMDPQQRQLLEVTWQALENAGQNPEELRGSLTGVYIGISSNSEYAQLVKKVGDINEYIGTGNTSSIASGRVAYAFGWTGPALSVDTACSSSLVSTHLAVEALRRGECEMAVAGGVNMMLAPGVMASLCSMNALAKDGRSKPFDASADGYGRGEGCGIVVLKRLSDAQRDGDTVYAVIRGGAVNNDGESSGLTTPNGRAQKAVLARALANTGLTPHDIDYVETHGTGTLLGDPIEIDAIHQVYGKDRDASRPLVLGAVKGNIGHLESAAGIASLIKTVLCLYHGEVPPVTGLTELNPRIKPVAGAFSFPAAAEPWPETGDRPRFAAISSFGFSGTNAHLILSDRPDPAHGQPANALPAADRVPLTASLLTLSAMDEEKLVRQIRAFDEHLASHPDLPPEDVCFTANATRASFDHRAVFLGRTLTDLRRGLRAALRAYEDNKTLYSESQVILGSSHGSDRYNAKRTLFTTIDEGHAYTALTDEKIRPKLVFLFSGEPGDTFTTARGLWELFPAFREAMTEALAVFEDDLGPQAEAFAQENGTPAGPAEEQAWLFAAEYALSKLLASYGITPEITFGERTGTLAAAVISGVLTLDAAARHLAALRRAQQAADAVGFARVVLDGADPEALADEFPGVHLSAVYSSSDFVLSGAPEELARATDALSARGATVTEEPGSFPSAGYEPRAAAWREAVGGETYQQPGSRFQSPFTLRTSHHPEVLREDFHDYALTAPIRFAQGLEELYNQGYRFFVEIGAGRPREGTTVLDRDDVVTLPLVENGTALETLLETLAKLICLGSTPTWDRHYEGLGRRKLMLPNYPFEQSSYWLVESREEEVTGLQARLAGRLTRDGLMGEPLNLPMRQKQWVYTFAHQNFPELLDNSGVVHVGYYLEMLRGVMAEMYGDQPCRVTGMRFLSPIMVFAEDTKEVLLALDPRDDGGFDFAFHSKNAASTSWDLNVQGTIAAVTGEEDEELLPLAELREQRERHEKTEDFYYPLEKERGFYFGPAVRWVEEAWHNGTEGLIGFRMPQGPAAKRGYALGFHPGVLDSCAQSCNYLALERTPAGKKYMVAELDDVLITPGEDVTGLFADIRMPEYDSETEELGGTIRLTDESGATLVRIGRIRLKEFDEEKLGELRAMLDADGLEKDGEDRDFLMRYIHADVEQKPAMALEYLRTMLALILEMDLSEVDPDEHMRTFGLDSMTGLRFFNKIGQLLDVDISFADVVKSRNLRELSLKLVDMLPGGAGVLRDAQRKAYDLDLSPAHWIYRYEEKPEARIRLFCFPNGYRNADLFDDWQDQLGPEVDVCPIMLPGMDAKRLDERAPEDINEFMATMEKVVDPDLFDIPCASFGHSWGALFSFRLAARLGANPRARFLKAFVSGFAAPNGPNPNIAKILDEIGKHGLTRIPAYEEIRHDQETVNAVIRAYMNGWGYGEAETRATLPQLLAACRLIESFTYDPEEKFEVPLTAFHGVDDWVASKETKLWEQLTTGSFRMHTMAGDHQFINKEQSEGRLLALIREELMEALEEAEAAE
ncbi:type I polyketide synthase [Streptomyces sp. 7-21]|uniref:type I polyketide synthase n=1 Tax=Streptomyces sp. 7-21 TaxID=2802283 RepID=UPI00191E82B3|nr:type I polyketide synthase [Streptomyces sp. 7-21]MBL1065924.1 polyketide synthase dehydratase domain-containing protein [Streptomyces sp. 7-21]